jgi:hypothetical protein
VRGRGSELIETMEVRIITERSREAVGGTFTDSMTMYKAPLDTYVLGVGTAGVLKYWDMASKSPLERPRIWPMREALFQTKM